MYNVTIIGAGFSGLSASVYLAQKGYNINILEKNDIPGGRARNYSQNGFTFDLGPSWYWMPDVLERFFNNFGKSTSDFYQLRRLNPGYRIFFAENDFIDVPANLEHLYDLFESLDRGSSKRLKKFLKHAEYKYNLGIGKIVYKPGLNFIEFISWDLLSGLFYLNVFSTVATVVSKVSKEKKLRQLLEFPVLFLGSIPQKTPALYTLMNYADLVLGTWYPMGGMFKVVEAMVHLAESLGVKINYNSDVELINIETSKITSVIAGNKQYDMDILVGSADYHHIEQRLIPEKYRRYNEKYWDSRVLAPSAILFYLGINNKLPKLKHHNLFFDVDFYKHADEIYTHPQWPENPAIYVSCTSRTDPTVAPEGSENLTILIPVAPGLNDTEKERERLYEYAVAKIEKFSGENVRNHVIVKKIYALNDFVKDYHSYKGNAYGLANTLMQTAFLKPKLVSKKLSNLFYAGQLTVPGPGVPPSIISGEIVAKLIARRFKQNIT